MLRRIIELNRNLRVTVDRTIFASSSKYIWMIRPYLYFRAKLFNLLVRHLKVWMPDGLNVTMALALKSNDVFIDAGANVGWMTERAAFSAGSKARIYAIEPSPESFRKLSLRQKIMRLDNVTLVQNAIGAAKGTVPFYEFSENHGGASSLNKDAWPGHEPTKVTIVEMVSLDFVIHTNKIDQVKLIKVDVQGAECGLLKSGQHLFGNLSPILYIEVEKYALEAFGNSVEEMLGAIKAFGYEMFSWRSNGLVRVESPTDIPEAGHDDLICLKPKVLGHAQTLKELSIISNKKMAWLERSFTQ